MQNIKKDSNYKLSILELGPGASEPLFRGVVDGLSRNGIPCQYSMADMSGGFLNKLEIEFKRFVEKYRYTSATLTQYQGNFADGLDAFKTCPGMSPTDPALLKKKTISPMFTLESR